jgi:hypothetical protein
MILDLWVRLEDESLRATRGCIDQPNGHHSNMTQAAWTREFNARADATRKVARRDRAAWARLLGRLQALQRGLITAPAGDQALSDLSDAYTALLTTVNETATLGGSSELTQLEQQLDGLEWRVLGELVARQRDDAAQSERIASAESLLRDIVEHLQSGSEIQKQDAAIRLWRMTIRATPGFPVVASAARAIPLLAALLRSGMSVQQEIAALALWALAQDAAHVQAIVATDGLIDLLVRLVKTGSDAAKQFAAWMLWTLAAAGNANKTSIVNAGGMAPLVALAQTAGLTPLVALARDGTCSEKERALWALTKVAIAAAQDENLQQEIAKVGAVLGATMCLRDGSIAVKQLAAELLNRLGRGHGHGLPRADAIESLIDLACKANEEDDARTALTALGWMTAVGRNCVLDETEAMGPCTALIRDNDATDPLAFPLENVRPGVVAPLLSANHLGALVSLLHGDVPDLVERTASVLVNLSLLDTNKTAVASSPFSLRSLITLLHEGTSRQKVLALCTLRNLACSGDINAKTTMAEAGAVDALVQILQGDVTSDQEETALVTLWHLADNHNANKKAIAKADAIPAVVSLVHQWRTPRQREAAAGLLWNLALAPTAIKARIVKAGAIRPLVDLVQRGTGPQKLNAAGALCSLAAGNDAIKQAIEELDGIAPLVALAQDGTSTQRLYAEWAVAYTRRGVLDHRRQVEVASWHFAVAAVVVVALAWGATQQMRA